MDYALLKQLTNCAGISGREERVRAIVSEHLSRLGLKSTIDAMGNLVASRPGKGLRVALIAHMDEVGFMVSKIDKDGFLRVLPVGGIDPQVFYAQKVTVHGRSDLTGVVGSVPPHLRKGDKNSAKAPLPIAEGFIDLGLPAEEVAAQVSIGDPVTFATRSWETSNAYFGKALDDRLGLFIMLTVLEKMTKVACELVLIASTQEEYGLRGVGPAMFKAAPHIALILEGTVASDTPGLKLPANITPTRQSKGPEIRLSDKRMVADRRLADFLSLIANERNLPHQLVAKDTGATDAAAAQLVASGIIVGAVAVPTRYIHAPISMALKTDIAHTRDLVTAFVEEASRFEHLPSI